MVPGALEQQGAQGLLAVFERAHRAVQDAARRAIEYPQDARQTPVGRFFAIAGPMGWEVLGNVIQGPQAAGRTVDQAHRQPEPFGRLDGGGGLGGRVPEGLAQKFQGQALTGITEGGGGFGGQLLRQGNFAAGAQAVGTPLAGIFDDMAEGVIVAEPLEEEVPQRDERRIGSLIKGPLGKIQPRDQPGGRQELGEVALELAGGKAGAQQLGGLGLLATGFGLWFGGRLSRVGFGVCHECMYYGIHTYHARPTPSKATVAKSNRLPLASLQRLTGQGL